MTTATVSPPKAKTKVRSERGPWPRWLSGLIGFGIILVGWQIAGMTFLSSTIPPPTAIVNQMTTDGFAFYWPNIVTTAREAAWGWVYGNTFAIVLAVLFVQVPLVERGLMRVAIAMYCLPIIAIGPILQILFDGDTPKIILAALTCFFTTLIGAVVGLRSVDPTSMELVRAYGGGSWAQFRRLRIKASLPSLFAGLRIAAPAAILGAIIGEYLGGENGIGVAMINSQQSFNLARTWSFALIATAMAGIAYGITAIVGRLLTPWAPRTR
jgi:ABC-type nitrate/sulfonate/bicarbonate transport system permease component